MKLEIIYIICLSSVFGLLTTWRISLLLSSSTKFQTLLLLRKWIYYTQVIKRINGSSSWTVSRLFLLISYIIINILFSVLATLSAINLIVPFLGGRTNIICDRVFTIDLPTYELMHRWIGRVGICMATIGIFTLLPLRRYVFKLFQKIHFVSVLTLLVSLWYHINVNHRLPLIYLSIASTLQIYRNTGTRSRSDMVAEQVSSAGLGPSVFRLTCSLKRKWEVKPGQYIYVTIPGLAKHRLLFLQSHPYYIAWEDQCPRSGASLIHIIIEERKGFTSMLRHIRPEQSIIIRGPYGAEHKLHRFDKVLFLYNELSLASQLLAIRNLLEAHNDQSARLRRLSLVWLLHTHVEIKLTSGSSKVDKGNESQQFSQISARFYKVHEKLNISWLIDREWMAEAGNMAISVYGTPSFEKSISKAVYA
ncbi:hypothetical protein M501DRAFT_1009802 [Patellaria atrata CBS 101060]|uniref:ferric-chelate reductase (NADPH) n=1 Tax=Patellaria atrata CBS 101060 TaxID=1346257 RepID=A0A9P4S138_9PEZI|nr:hypothetical protein M501DRAFT_1009802 [Patellaria atrata CBS 101060]